MARAMGCIVGIRQSDSPLTAECVCGEGGCQLLLKPMSYSMEIEYKNEDWVSVNKKYKHQMCIPTYQRELQVHCKYKGNINETMKGLYGIL